MSHDRNLLDDYHVSADYQHSGQQSLASTSTATSTVLPKVRQNRPDPASDAQPKKQQAAVMPATPRMLRNTSGSLQKQFEQIQNSQNAHDNEFHNALNPGRTPSSAAQQQQLQQQEFQQQQQQPQQRLQEKPNIFQSPAKQTANQHTNLPPIDTEQPTPALLPAAKVNNQDQQQKQQEDKISPKLKKSQQPFHRHSIGEWDFAKTIGAGSMGKVKLARHRRTNELCAIKIVPRASRTYARAHMNDPPPNSSKEALQRQKEYEKEIARDNRTIREASLGKILYHPFICRLFEVVTMSNHYYMLFEYVAGGQMLDYIVSHGSLKERHARKFARGIASALEYLHGNNIVHRDLKIENIMISKTGDIKIIDFGLSNLYSNQSLLKTFCGSLYFAAPELLSAFPYVGPEVDVWSFGVVLYVLVCGKVPFDDPSVPALHEKIKKGKVEYPDFLSAEVVSLLSRMLVVNPSKRAKLSEVVNHPWLTKGFEGPPSSFIPHRVPLTDSLDPNVIKEMKALEFGDSEEMISTKLLEVLNSSIYKESCKYWYECQKNGVRLDSNKPDPTKSFHPLISLYYLVDEMLKRKLAKKAMNNDVPTKDVEIIPNEVPVESQQQQSQIRQQISSLTTPKLNTPQPPPVLSFPQAAHTSPIHSTPPLVRPSLEQQLSPKEVTPQLSNHQRSRSKSGANHEDDGSGKGFNIFRKFSQRRVQSQKLDQHNKIDDSSTPKIQFLEPHVPQQQKTRQDSFVRRVGSLKLTREYTNDEYNHVNNNNITRSHTRTVSEYSGASDSNGNSTSNKPSLPTNMNPSNTSNYPGDKLSVPAAQTSSGKKYHPSARAKSVGHAHYRTASTSYNSNQQPNGSDKKVPPLPTDINEDAFFDDVTLDNFPSESNGDKVTLVDSNNNRLLETDLNEDEILEEASRAPPGSMPSIEYPRTMFLKGFFSVQTTSTKPLPIIRANIISVLTKLNVKFTEVRGGFICVHTPSIEQPTIVPVDSNNKEEVEGSSIKTDNSHHYSNGTDGSGSMEETSNVSLGAVGSTTPKVHRRKFSIGGSILGYRRKPSTGAAPQIPPTPVAASQYSSNTQQQMSSSSSPINRHVSRSTDYDSSASLDSLSGDIGASDMLVSSRIAQNKKNEEDADEKESKEGEEEEEDRKEEKAGNFNSNNQRVVKTRSPLKFEIHIVKIPLVGLFGVQFKKVSGNAWMYKALAGQILGELKL